MDTIFAPICPLGGSIVSVRFSGEKALEILNAFSVDKLKYINKNGTYKQLFFTKLIVDNKIFDEVIIKIFLAPHSFTGENVVEIDLHASRLILQDFLHFVSKINGFRFATNGEFTKRAFLNGKIDLLKSEGINAIIRAETHHQQQLANSLFYGETYNKYKIIRQKLIDAMAFIETSIDFSEENIPQEIIENIKTIIIDLKKEIEKYIEYKPQIDKINNGIIIAITGKPNVGKSSLLNWLAKKDIAIVSSIAGTTRDLLSVDVEIEGYKVIFYDTAGIRESNDEIEQEGVKRAKQIAKDADIKITIFDNANDTYNYVSNNNITSNEIVVLNKIDIQQNDINNKIDNIINISVLKQQNMQLLMEEIKKQILKQMEFKQNPIAMNERHFILLKQAVEILKHINFNTMPIEIIAEEIKQISELIGKITGQIYTDDVLDKIFSTFCIGK